VPNCATRFLTQLCGLVSQIDGQGAPPSGLQFEGLGFRVDFVNLKPAVRRGSILREAIPDSVGASEDPRVPFFLDSHSLHYANGCISGQLQIVPPVGRLLNSPRFLNPT